jgi:hypothetical protein
LPHLYVAASVEPRRSCDGVDGVQELDGVHGDLRSEPKCVQELDGVHGGRRSEVLWDGEDLTA